MNVNRNLTKVIATLISGLQSSFRTIFYSKFNLKRFKNIINHGEITEVLRYNTEPLIAESVLKYCPQKLCDYQHVLIYYQ